MLNQFTCWKYPCYRVSNVNANGEGNFSMSPTWSTRPTTGCGARSTFLRVHMNLFWHLSGDGNLHGSGMSHATTASPKPSFRAPWKVGDAVIDRGNAGWTSKSAYSCPCQSCSQGPPAEKTGIEFLLNCPSCPPPMTKLIKGLNWMEQFSQQAIKSQTKVWFTIPDTQWLMSEKDWGATLTN